MLTVVPFLDIVSAWVIGLLSSHIPTLVIIRILLIMM